jgi:hypothetical protein
MYESSFFVFSQGFFIVLVVYPRVAANFLFRYRKISHDNMYLILIWKRSINAKSITDTILDIASYDFSQSLIFFPSIWQRNGEEYKIMDAIVFV